jgi:hypothetical protein
MQRYDNLAEIDVFLLIRPPSSGQGARLCTVGILGPHCQALPARAPSPEHRSAQKLGGFVLNPLPTAVDYAR